MKYKKNAAKPKSGGIIPEFKKKFAVHNIPLDPD
jgi:hypothetical protein